MSPIERYGIKVGQRYARADGADHILEVTDTTTFAHCDDVVVKETICGLTLRDVRRIDAFKLAMVRYSLLPTQPLTTRIPCDLS